MVKSAGALLNFIDRNNESGEGAMVLAIRRFVLPDVVSVDQVTLSALQIFNSNWQPSGCKAGNWNRMREGLSLFKVLNRCKSVAGMLSKSIFNFCFTILFLGTNWDVVYFKRSDVPIF